MAADNEAIGISRGHIHYVAGQITLHAEYYIVVQLRQMQLASNCPLPSKVLLDIDPTTLLNHVILNTSSGGLFVVSY